MTTPLETFRAALATVPDGNVTVTLAGTGALEITVTDFATALDVTRITTPVVAPVTPVVAYQLIVNTADLNVHDLPALVAPLVGDILLNTVVDVYTDDPVVFDGHTWLHIHTGVLTGWCVEDYLKAKSIPVVVAPVPTPAPTPTPVVTKTPVTVNHRAYVNTSLLHVRAAGSTTAVILGSLMQNTMVDVYSDLPIVDALYTWAHVKSGALEGWCAQQFLTTGTPPVAATVTPVATVAAKPKRKTGLHVFEDGNAAIAFAAAHPVQSVTILNALKMTSQFPTVPYVLYRVWPDQFSPPSDPTQASAYGTKLATDRWPSFAGADPRAYIEITNEGGWNTGSNEFWLAVMQFFEAHGRKVALGVYSVGNPEPDQWAQMAPALRHAKANGHIVALHAYCGPDTPPGQLTGVNSQYFELRAARLYAAVPADCRPPLVFSEFQGEYSRGKFQGTDALISLCTAFEAATASWDFLVAYNLWSVGTEGGTWADASIDDALDSLGKWLAT